MSVQVVRVGESRPRGVAVGVARPALGQLADVDGTAEAPVDEPLVWRKGTDQVFRPEPALEGGGVEIVQGLIDAAVGEHRAADEPHPAYDDLLPLSLIFENGLI